MSDHAREGQSAGERYLKRRSAVLVIIPAYNEEESIGQVVADVKRSAGFADVLVVNDGSTDRTAAVARLCGADVLNLPYNLGIGGAVRAGYKLAEEMGYAFVVRLDGDGQHNPDDIPRLLAPVQLGQADVAFGCRFCGGSTSYRTSLGRWLGIRVFSLVLSLLLRQRIHDVTSGLRCANRKAVRYFARYYPQDYPEVESHILLYKAGLSEVEVPVTMRARIGGRSSITLLRSVYYAFKVLLAILVRAFQEVPYLFGEEAYAVESADPGSLD